MRASNPAAVIQRLLGKGGEDDTQEVYIHDYVYSLPSCLALSSHCCFSYLLFKFKQLMMMGWGAPTLVVFFVLLSFYSIRVMMSPGSDQQLRCAE